MSKLKIRALITRVRAAIRYLGWADPFYKWRLSSSSCPGCGGKLFLSLKKDETSLVNTPFMTRCLKCGSNITNLSLIPVIKSHARRSEIVDAYEMSTYGATLKYLKQNCSNVVTSEYFPERTPGELMDGIRNEDVQRLSFCDESLDLITSNQVFEHVPEDIVGYAECFRALRPGGALIFSVPLTDNPATIMAAEITGVGVVYHQEPEYHSSRAGGPNSALVFWHHSIHDICSRVSQVGFKASIVDVVITPIQLVPQKVVYARKEALTYGQS